MESQNRQFAAALAAALGPEWSVEPATQDWHQRHPTVKRNDGPNFWLSGGPDDSSYGSKRGQWTVHANYPVDELGKENIPYRSEWRNDMPNPSINFSATKSPEQAARDITRRFLPEYLRQWDIQKAQVDSSNNYRAKRKALAELVAPIVGGEVVTVSELAAVRVPYTDKNPRINDIELSNEDGVTFKVHGSVALLKQVQELLKLF